MNSMIPSSSSSLPARPSVGNSATVRTVSMAGEFHVVCDIINYRRWIQNSRVMNTKESDGACELTCKATRQRQGMTCNSSKDKQNVVLSDDASLWSTVLCIPDDGMLFGSMSDMAYYWYDQVQHNVYGGIALAYLLCMRETLKEYNVLIQHTDCVSVLYDANDC